MKNKFRVAFGVTAAVSVSLSEGSVEFLLFEGRIKDGGSRRSQSAATNLAHFYDTASGSSKKWRINNFFLCNDFHDFFVDGDSLGSQRPQLLGPGPSQGIPGGGPGYK